MCLVWAISCEVAKVIDGWKTFLEGWFFSAMQLCVGGLGPGAALGVNL